MTTKERWLSAMTMQPIDRLPFWPKILNPNYIRIHQNRLPKNSMSLEELNGYHGVQRGSFKLIDGQGSEAVISLSDAATLADVTDKINQAGINVRAEVRGDGLVLTETTGGVLRVCCRIYFSGNRGRPFETTGSDKRDRRNGQDQYCGCVCRSFGQGGGCRL